MTTSEREPAEASVGIAVDPEFANLIPPLTRPERGQLEANILRDGVLDPIKVWKGVILDGHNRYEIAEAHGLEYDIDELDFPDRDAAKVWIIQHQLGRRNLEPYSRVELALALEETLAKQALERKRAAGKKAAPGRPAEKDVANSPQVTAGKTRDQIAKAAGVGAKTVDAVKSIKKAEAEGKVDEETIDKLRAGEVSINAVAKQVKPPKAKSQAQKEREKAAAIMAKQDAEAEAKADDEWEEVDPPGPDTPPPLSTAKFSSALDKIHDKVMDLIYRSSVPQRALIQVRLMALHDEASEEVES